MRGATLLMRGATLLMRGATLGVMFALLFVGRPALAGVEAEVEGAIVFASRNDARIPGVGGRPSRWSTISRRRARRPFASASATASPTGTS